MADGEEVPMWKTVQGDMVTRKGPNGTDIVFAEDPVNGEGIKKDDPVPEALRRNLIADNDLAREWDSKHEGEAIVA